MDKKKQKKEAIKRMEDFKLPDDILEDYRERGEIYLSIEEEKGWPLLNYYHVIDYIRDWEKETENLAYYSIYTNTIIGPMVAILYVSKHEDEWEMERKGAKDYFLITYVCVADLDYYIEHKKVIEKNGEYGYIEIKKNEYEELMRIG